MLSFHSGEMRDGFDPKEPGRYGAEVIEVKVGSTSKDDEMWTLRFNDTESGSYLCSDNLFFSEKARGFSFKKIALKIADSIGAIATMISVFATFVFCIDNIKVILVAVKVIA